MKNFFKFNRALVAKKKLFTFFAFAAIMLSFAACGDGNDPQNERLDIQISDVSSITATITIKPTDPNAWYFCKCLSPFSFGKGDGTKYTLQELVDEQLDVIKDWSFEQIKPHLVQGEQSQTKYYLDPETEYVVVALQFDENGKLVGKVASKSFTTGPEYVDLGLSVLWSAGVYGIYTFQEAKAKFGNSLPTAEQWEELRDNCTWERRDDDDAFWFGKHWIVRSKTNNNFIVLEQWGYMENDKIKDRGVGYFWSRSGEDSQYNEASYFNLPDCEGCMGMDVADQEMAMLVHRVKEK